MVELLARNDINLQPSTKDLLNDDETIVIVDDSPEILLLLETYLKRQNIPVEKARNAKELAQIFANHHVALVLLDIGLPGKSGTEILAELAPKYPDLGIIMVTGTTSIKTALECLRLGADDYLTKPLIPFEFNYIVHQTLKKRRLAIESRAFQKELELTNFRMQFLHNLNLKMNTAYLNALELDSVLHTILSGITSDEGLKFNRAFLALFDEKGETLSGKLAIGPASREEADGIWQEIKKNKLGLHDILSGIAQKNIPDNPKLNQTAQALQVSVRDEHHIFIRSSVLRKSIIVRDGATDDAIVPASLIQLLDEKNFVVVPLFSPSQSLGVIIADNFVTGAAISESDVMALEIFANQASLAIEHSHLYRDMTSKIQELELVTEELDKNKDMLVEAERYSTIGYISAQLVHAIRNPLTSIGGTARLLLKRTDDVKIRRFLKVMADEATKIEDTLKNLTEFVEDIALETQPVSISTLLKECVASFYPALRKSEIELVQNCLEEDIILAVDPRKIRQVFLHLIRNCVEAMPAGGTLSITAEREGEELVVNIADTGHGISSSSLDSLSDPFYTTKTYGTGLGLTLVEQILDLHGASFTLQQLDPQGTRASIRFSLSRNQETSTFQE